MSNDIFRLMSEQMQPNEKLIAKLEAAIAAEPETDAFSERGEYSAEQLVSQSQGLSHEPDSLHLQQVAKSPQPQQPQTSRAQDSQGQPQDLHARSKRKWPKAIYISAAAVLALTFVAVGLVLANNMGWLPKTNPVADLLASDTQDSRSPLVGDQSLLSAEGVASDDDYSEIYAKIKALNSDISYSAGSADSSGEFMTEEDSAGLAGGSTTDSREAQGSAPNEAKAEELAAADPSAVESAAPIADSLDVTDSASSQMDSTTMGIPDAGTTEDHSDTNVQVEGIDEADIVKTDGKHIYVLSKNELVIFEAAGKDTLELSRTKITTDEGAIDADTDGDSAQASTYLRKNPRELFMYNDKIFAVIDDTSVYGYYDMAASSVYPGTTSETILACIDVSDPTSPAVETLFAQSGDYSSSRINSGKLYLITSYFVYGAIEEDSPETYVPMISQDGNSELMRAGDIAYMPSVDSSSYTVVTSIDCASLERIDQKSILGQAYTVYMSANNLYLASTVYSMEEQETYRDETTHVIQYTDKQTTQITRVSITDGLLEVASQGVVNGSLLNQFSLDEYLGNLRLVVTNDNYSYKILYDDLRDIEYYEANPDTSQTNALYILDPALTVIGSLEGLAEDERIYSARFSGEVGYMVTFKQVDPLFAMDLSDPTNPQITSELKIPGFSEYLHPYGAGKLLGLGRMATEEGTTLGLKLSMFDVSDPFNVTESTWIEVGADSTAASYNHKAILVDVDKNIFAFAAASYNDFREYYFVYSYSEDLGFKQLAKLDFSRPGEAYYSEVRGLYIGEYLYIYSDYYLDVYDMNTYEKLSSLVIRDYEEPYYGIGGAVPLRGTVE